MSNKLTPATLAELAAKLDAMTPGEWKAGIDWDSANSFDQSQVWVESKILGRFDTPWESNDQRKANAIGTCALHNHARELIAAAMERDALRAALLGVLECSACFAGGPDAVIWERVRNAQAALKRAILENAKGTTE